MRLKPLLAGLILGAAALFDASAALADAIDGDWCHADGRSLSIEGPAIVTPGGKRIAGHYGRHDFSYVVPAPEPSAGQTVETILVNDELMRLRVGANGAMQNWQRCHKPVS